MTMPRVIIDTDPGHDDAIALILADCLTEVVGVTTVAGNAALPHTTHNALRILELLESKAEVHQGEAIPLKGAAQLATEVHGHDGLGGVELPEPKREMSGLHAVDYLLDAVEPDIWVVPIGPLTNIARVIQRDPQWVHRIAGLSIMGGSATGGNVTPSAEFNIYFDPEAADIVFRSGANLRMCGLNLTMQVQISPQDVAEVKCDPDNNPLHEFANQNFRCVFERLQQLTGDAALAMHDPCAVLAVSHPHLFKFTPRSVQVELDGSLTRGMTIVDSRNRAEPEPTNVDVGYEVDVEKVKELLLRVLYPV